MPAFYNEIDPKAAAWLRELIREGHIADGEVDERDIQDIRPADLSGFTQCHFFAGIGVWSYALRCAGWPGDRPVWTGSCPCQPFSAAGKGGGFADERHLWPAFHHLIEQCRPPVVLGEQVASKDGLAWLDLVQADLEGTGYASGAVDTCAAGVGAPHIRQRLYWIGERLADADDARSQGRALPAERAGERLAGQGGLAGGVDDTASARHVGTLSGPEGAAWDEARLRLPDAGRGDGGLADADGRDAGPERQQRGGQQRQQPEDGRVGGVADDTRSGRREERADAGRQLVGDRTEGLAAGLGASGSDMRPGPTNGLWRDADWLFCRDGKWRPVEPGTFPLATGSPERVGRLRGYGNAIVAPAAQAFIEAYLEAEAMRAAA